MLSCSFVLLYAVIMCTYGASSSILLSYLNNSNVIGNTVVDVTQYSASPNYADAFMTCRWCRAICLVQVSITAIDMVSAQIIR